MHTSRARKQHYEQSTPPPLHYSTTKYYCRALALLKMNNQIKPFICTATTLYRIVSSVDQGFYTNNQKFPVKTKTKNDQNHTKQFRDTFFLSVFFTNLFLVKKKSPTSENCGVSFGCLSVLQYRGLLCTLANSNYCCCCCTSCKQAMQGDDSRVQVVRLF